MTSHAKYRRVVGLSYGGTNDLPPAVSLKGELKIADQIVKIARRYRIPVVEKPDLVEALDPLEVDQPIPARLFEPVAIILAQLKRLFKS